MSRNNPLPVSLQQECRKACKIFSSFVDPVQGLDHIIPPSILRKAKGFAFITIVKAGFVFSARAGTGVVIARLKDGTWSAPSAIGTAGVGAGFQMGAEITEFMIILNSSAAVKSFMAKGSLTLGGNMSVSAGPLGRNLEGTGTLSAKGGVSAMYSYSRSKGLFGGASIEGSIIVERSDANSKAYNQNVTAKQLLSGAVDMPGWAFELGDTIKRRSGKDNRIPGWIEDGEDVDRGRGDREYDSDDEDGEEREMHRRSDGLTPREYGERGYSFGSQYAQGGSHLSKADSYSGSTSKERSSSPSTTGGRERSGSTGGKFSGMLGSIGRSRSGSGASAIGMSKKDSNNGGMSSGDRGERNASSRQGGPISGEDYNFGTKFESTYESEQAQKYTSSTSSPLRSPPLTKKDFSLIDAEDPFSEGNSLPIMSTDPPPAATKRPGMFSRNSSSKLTKSRSGSGNGNALRERVGQMNWDTFGGSQNRDQDEDPSRASFDSLDDERPTNDDPHTRKRASTLQGTSNSSDVLSSYQRPPLSSSKSGSGRTRSFTSPFGGGGGSSSPSLFSKKKKPEQTAYNDPMREMRERNGGGGGGGSELYPIRSNDSFGQLNSDSEFNDPDYTERKDGGGGRNRGDSNPSQASWRDTSAEDRGGSARPSQSRSNSARGDAFDFKQVGRDFDESTTNGGNRSRSGTVTSSGGGGGRSRSGTVTGATSTKGGIGTATAKYDFRGVEATDLPFNKNDVLTILNKDDEEWWKARFKLKEGMIPRNYVHEIEWF